MNINASLKIQNVRSLNLSLGIDITRKKIDALTHESNDIIFIINTQIGKNKSTVYWLLTVIFIPIKFALCFLGSAQPASIYRNVC